MTKNKGSMSGHKKVKGHVRRRMKAREPKLVEDDKTAVFLKYKKSSESLNRLVTDLVSMKKPKAIRLTRKNDIKPFEDHSRIEQICQQHDAALFAFSSDTKKRPSNLILGRMFDYQLLDMIEFGITNISTSQDMLLRAKSLQLEKLKKDQQSSAANQHFDVPLGNNAIWMGSKPCLLFLGEGFEYSGLQQVAQREDLSSITGSMSAPNMHSKGSDNNNGNSHTTAEVMGTVKNLLLDWFRGQEVQMADLATLDFVIVFTSAPGGKIFARTYEIGYMKRAKKRESIFGGGDASSMTSLNSEPGSIGSNAPHIILKAMGPCFDMILRRSHIPSLALMKLATKQPPKLRGAKKVKNVNRDEVRGRLGQIHLKKQDLTSLVTRSRFKALKGRGKEKSKGRTQNARSNKRKGNSETSKQTKRMKR